MVGWLGGGRDSETQALEQQDAAEAQGKKAGAQQVPKGRQVGDGEVVRVQAPPPHQADDEVGDVEEDGHLEGRGKLLLKAVCVVHFLCIPYIGVPSGHIKRAAMAK